MFFPVDAMLAGYATADTSPTDAATTSHISSMLWNGYVAWQEWYSAKLNVFPVPETRFRPIPVAPPGADIFNPDPARFGGSLLRGTPARDKYHRLIILHP